MGKPHIYPFPLVTKMPTSRTLPRLNPRDTGVAWTQLGWGSIPGLWPTWGAQARAQGTEHAGPRETLLFLPKEHETLRPRDSKGHQ